MSIVEATTERMSHEQRPSDAGDTRPIQTYQVGSDWYARWPCPHCGAEHTTLLKWSGFNPPGENSCFTLSL